MISIAVKPFFVINLLYYILPIIKSLKYDIIISMKGSKKLVSIIIPVYNVEKYLCDCLSSVARQTYDNLEVIIVNDGSPDNSVEIAEKWVAQDSRFKLVSQENRGLNGAREVGFVASNGELIFFLDSDDVLYSRAIEVLVENLGQNDISVGGYQYFEDEILSEELGDFEVKNWGKDTFSKKWLAEDFDSSQIFPQTAWGKIFRREIIEGVNWAASNYKINEDEFMSAMFYAAAKKISVVDAPLYFYRRNPNSITAGYQNKTYENFFEGKKISRSQYFADLARIRLKYFSRYKTEIFNSFMGQIGYFVLRQGMLFDQENLEDGVTVLREFSTEIKRSIKKLNRADFYAQMVSVAIDEGVEGLEKWWKNQPLISVVIPIYNTEKYLEECVKSVLSQSYFNLEVLLIDDGSKDGSGEICDRFAAQDSRVKVFHLENGGVSRARNFAIERATGEYFTLVDSDDFLPGDAIEKMVQSLPDGGVDVLAARVVFKEHQKLEGYFQPDILTNKVFDAKKVDQKTLLTVWDGLNIPVAKLYNTEHVKKNNLTFPEGIKIGEDLVFVVKALLLADKILAINDEVYFYRRDNENSATRTLTDKKFEFGKALLAIEDFIQENFSQNEKIVKMSKAGAVKHSYYTFGEVENNTTDHRDVFYYIKNDLWPKLNIDGDVVQLHDHEFAQMKAILAHEYVDFLLWKINSLRKDVKIRDECIIGFNHHTANLQNELNIAKSFKGSVKGSVRGFGRVSKRAIKKVIKR